MIYQDLEHEKEMREGLEQTFEAIKSLVSAWNSLDVGPCRDIMELANDARGVYAKAYKSLIKVPEQIDGHTLRREEFLKIIEIPEPQNLYDAAKAVLGAPCFGYQGIWSIKDGEVIQNQDQIANVIHARNIYANNQHQKELAEAIVEYVRLSNYIDGQFKTIPWQYFPAPPWTLVGRSFPNVAMLTLEVEQLRTIISKLD
ncbi:MAG: hypothetical protein U5K32_12900 [Bacteroidales bacterium]|nr:hypothetical protein [Bacteroidales bacterium]